MHRKKQVMILEKDLENFSQEFCKTLSNSKDFSSPLFDKTLIVYVRDPGPNQFSKDRIQIPSAAAGKIGMKSS